MSKTSTYGQFGHIKAKAKGVIDSGKGSNVNNCLYQLSTITFGFWCKQLTNYLY